MGGEGFYEAGGILRYGYAPQHRFPDGNHTIARHLLKAILPLAAPGPPTLEGIFNSRIDYAALDLPKNRARVRLPFALKIMATKTAAALSFIIRNPMVAFLASALAASSCWLGAWRPSILCRSCLRNNGARWINSVITRPSISTLCCATGGRWPSWVCSTCFCQTVIAPG